MEAEGGHFVKLNPVQIEATGLELEPQGVNARFQIERIGGNIMPGAPTITIGERVRCRAGTIDQHRERLVACLRGSDAGTQLVATRILHVNGVFEPLACRGVNNVVAAPCISTGLDIHIVAAVCAATVASRGVIVREILPARILVLGLDPGGLIDPDGYCSTDNVVGGVHAGATAADIRHAIRVIR